MAKNQVGLDTQTNQQVSQGAKKTKTLSKTRRDVSLLLNRVSDSQNWIKENRGTTTRRATILMAIIFSEFIVIVAVRRKDHWQIFWVLKPEKA